MSHVADGVSEGVCHRSAQQAATPARSSQVDPDADAAESASHVLAGHRARQIWALILAAALLAVAVVGTAVAWRSDSYLVRGGTVCRVRRA